MKFKQVNDYQLLATKMMYSAQHNLVIALLQRYVTMERSTTAEVALAEFVFDNIDAQALTILSVCMMNGKRAPIQTLIGTISSALLHKNLDQGKVIATYTCVAEFMIASPEIFKESTAFFGGRKIECILYSSEDAEKKLFQLPSFGVPSKSHRTLGKFNWDLTVKESLDKLNNVPLVLLDFEETSMPPKGTEERMKYEIRKAIRPHLAREQTPLYFTWNSDYRGRMYSSGLNVAR